MVTLCSSSSSSVISYFPITKTRRRNFQPNATHSTFGSPRDSPSTFGPLPVVTRRLRPTVRSGHRKTAHSTFGSLPVTTPSCNHSAIGHDPARSSWLIGEDLAKTQDERLEWTGLILSWTEPRLDHVDTDRPRQTDLDSDITFFNFWTVLRLPGGVSSRSSTYLNPWN
ncbi:hypothetical protein DY000_02041987 [Brassica cretica]|uniref:Uncharacterized protein n=1 Tax=Brassica cretica TaxID=69181 RepID=A0ABQ7BIP3_BRACR|nr:hypothetical protein DY000_02041987 [Brassica cretica]